MPLTDKEKARWKAIGEALDELNREAIEQDARRSPSENVRRVFELGDAALRIAQGFASPLEQKDKPSLVALWRMRKAYRG